LPSIAAPESRKVNASNRTIPIHYSGLCLAIDHRLRLDTAGLGGNFTDEASAVLSNSDWFSLLFANPCLRYYKIEVTRKGQDLYEVVGQSIYVKTRYCYEYVYYTDAILEIDSSSGYTIGEIIFVDEGGSKCDVEKLLR
jgi:hypothetical protein